MWLNPQKMIFSCLSSYPKSNFSQNKFLLLIKWPKHLLSKWCFSLLTCFVFSMNWVGLNKKCFWLLTHTHRFIPMVTDMWCEDVLFNVLAENHSSETMWWRQWTQLLWFLLCWLRHWSQQSPVMWTRFLTELSVIQIRGQWKERRREARQRERSLRDD